MLALHGFYRSSAAFRVRIALNLKGLEATSVAHHLRNNEHLRPDYLALNPQGFVPALEAEGRLLIQSAAIIEYLDERYPEPPLLPADPLDRAHVRALAQIVACDIHPLQNLRVLRYLRQPVGRSEAEVKDWSTHWIMSGFETLEALLARDDRTGRFCFGDRPGLADVFLVPQVFGAVANYAVDLGPYPTLARIVAACDELDAFMAARPDRQPDAE